MSEVSKKLKGLSKIWKKTKAAKGQVKVKDGKYLTEIIDNRIDVSKNKGTLMVVTLFQIFSPHKQSKKLLYKTSMLETKTNFSYLKKDLKTLCVKIPKDLLNLTKTLTRTIGLKCEVSVKTTEPYTNIWINRLIEEDDLEEEE